MENNAPKITVLPDATRDEQLAYWGVNLDSGLKAKNNEASNPAADFLAAGGWRVVSIKDSGETGGGLTSHRGVLDEDEFVDDELLLRNVEVKLGFTREQVQSVYRQGPLSSDQRELRDRIDARMLTLFLAGTHLTALGRVLGLNVTPDGHCRPLQNAITRAKDAA